MTNFTATLWFDHDLLIDKKEGSVFDTYIQEVCQYLLTIVRKLLPNRQRVLISVSNFDFPPSQ